MTKRSQWNSPRLPLPILLLALAVLVLSLAAGCGGGGGGGGNNNGNSGTGGGTVLPPVASDKSAIVGTVVDNIGSGSPVVGATVTVNSTPPVSVQSGTDGTFVVNNIPNPTTATTMVVTSPDTTKYANIVTYQNSYYNTDPSRSGGSCQIPLPTLTVGQRTQLPSNVIMFNVNPPGSNGNVSPPPPPPTGCF